MTKRCAYPGCGKPLPDSFKMPLCDYHRAVIKETGRKVGATIATTGTGVVLFVKNGGVEFVKKHGTKIVKVVEAIAKKR